MEYNLRRSELIAGKYYACSSTGHYPTMGKPIIVLWSNDWIKHFLCGGTNEYRYKTCMDNSDTQDCRPATQEEIALLDSHIPFEKRLIDNYEII